ncbi:hypothetical protein Y032_0010g1112 [Ancylostoma ceylanicum]|uniref:Uncharacterized protein n=1 Tax=Ancylostoma ceylanicum TaxID=53326 RepID=A0A016VFE5_9BILA|nr:hypothetical protein Y032_0010g1112 [Ancylostoma ceylanicum]
MRSCAGPPRLRSRKFCCTTRIYIRGSLQNVIWTASKAAPTEIFGFEILAYIEGTEDVQHFLEYETFH